MGPELSDGSRHTVRISGSNQDVVTGTILEIPGPVGPEGAFVSAEFPVDQVDLWYLLLRAEPLVTCTLEYQPESLGNATFVALQLDAGDQLIPPSP